jgi:hypothetical protein
MPSNLYLFAALKIENNRQEVDKILSSLLFLIGNRQRQYDYLAFRQLWSTNRIAVTERCSQPTICRHCATAD